MWYDEFDDEVADVKAWYQSRSVYVATAIGFGLGLLATWVF